ncbi:MATE family efflux transporter [Tenggerimyces flavus]|uniref:MATE family efflux transporter n=1 Tax=Tenggerimyces flavus TaxID=1708749 RepID=A0ABV7YIN6_9ACTN|nr:MATE family efflux transporter [Tenggerimyces flavus]MBM7784294.1 putative MATE family efflux protein [Tenggerimyces flavus]
MTLTRRLRDPHDKEIWRLAVPAFFALVAEPMFLLTDSAVVGHLGTPQLAGLGLAGTVLQTGVSLCIFLAYATTAAVARQLGAGDTKKAIQYGIDGIWLALGVGIALAAAGAIFAEPLVQLFNPSDAVAEQATIYLRIAALGTPAMLAVFAGTGVLRGLQDTKTPLVVAVGSYLANIVLNLALVYGLHWGIAGSAWGTVIAQYAGAAALIVVVLRGAKKHGAHVRPDWAGIKSAAGAGVPLIVRTAALRVGILLATVVATSFGDAPLAAHQVVFTIWNALALALDAVAIAGQAIVGRYLGAGDVEGTRAATRRMIEWGIAAGVLTGILLAVARPLYVPLFTEDPNVRTLISAAILVVAALQPVAGVVFVLDGVLIGAGDGRYLAWTGVLNVIAFIPFAALVWATDAGLVALWWAYAVYQLARLTTLSLRARSSTWLVTGALSRP